MCCIVEGIANGIPEYTIKNRVFIDEMQITLTGGTSVLRLIKRQLRRVGDMYIAAVSGWVPINHP